MNDLSLPSDQAIAQIMSTPRALFEAERHYIETLLENMPPDTFLEHISHDDSTEVDVFIDMLTFPTHQQRLLVEKDLTTWYHNAGESPSTNALVQSVFEQTPTLHVIWPTGKQVSFPYNFNHVSDFISRLQPLRTIPSCLQDLAAHHLSTNDAQELRVHYRQTRFHPTPMKLDILSQIIEAGRQFDDLLLDTFRYLSVFFEHYDENEPLEDALGRRRAENIQHIAGHARFLDQLKKSNFETMIMQGMRASHVEVPQLEHENIIIEAIGRHLFNRYYSLEYAPPQENDFGSFNGKEGVRNLLAAWNSTQ